MSDVLRLDGRAVTLLLALPPDGPPRMLHWGARLPDGLDAAAALALTERAAPRAGLDLDHPDDALVAGPGGAQFGHPTIAGSRDGRDWTAAFAGLSPRRSAQGLHLEGRDEIVGLELALEFRLDPADDVLRTRCELTNAGDTPYRLDWLAAGTFIVPETLTESLSFTGRWGGEFAELREPVGRHVRLRENRRGRTGHDSFPGLILGAAGFDEAQGEVFGFHLGWSGNHRLLVQPQDDGRLQVQLGELFQPGEGLLGPGERLVTPWAFAAFAADGLGALSASFHRHVRGHVLDWPGGRMRPRPVTLNTWEANYFAQEADRLRRQANAAARLGVERFVVDDGWFVGRRDDRAALGDWRPDPAKLPEGLGPIARHVTDLGMEFGLWVEPEMVNRDSALYRAHPDWVLGVADRPLLTARHQLVLDLTRAEVGNHLFGLLDQLLADQPIAYLKWDMNRDLTAAADATGAPAYRRQVGAVYALIDRLRAAHPDVEIESCASGGGRADYGILARTHRIWTSDCTDALERQGIQRGFLRFFPPEIMGAHVSAVPNHQTGRTHTLGFRAATALCGHFGLELDPLALIDTERDEMRTWIALHKRLRPLLHAGRVEHLPRAAGRGGLGVVAEDRCHALFVVAQEQAQPTRRPAPLRLQGLVPERRYALSMPIAPPPIDRASPLSTRLAAGETVACDGAWLGAIGLPLPELAPESALVLELVAV